MRRRQIVAGAAMLAAALGVTEAAAARPVPGPRAADFSMAVPRAAVRASATARRTVSRPVTAPRRFDLIGFTWRSGTAAIDLRVRSPHGRWSPWVRATTAGDHGPDGSPSQRATDPVWAGRSSAYQLRYAGHPRGLRASFVEVTGPRNVPRARASAHASAAPAIVPRSAWGADQCKPRTTPEYGEVKAAFVHHTVNANDYGPGDSAAIVLAICRYHRDSLGWNDIGYNFLVDRFGKVFEGRAGGIDRAVQGAQAQGYNAQSTGISNLGTFTDEPQTDAGIRAIAKLVAWKLALHGVPVTGSTTLVSAGGPTNRYPAGRTTIFQRISGHRDADSTECPGDALYAQLPEIRAMAAGSYVPLGGLVAAASARRVDYPSPVKLSGRLTFADGGKGVNLPIEIQFRVAGGAFATVATTTSDGGGRWFASVRADRSGFYRARYAGDSLRPETLSGPIGISVVPRLTAVLAASRVSAGSKVVVAGTISPAKRSLEIVIERRDRGRFRFLGRQPISARDGRYRARVKIGTVRLYRLRVRFVTDRENPSVRSGALLVRGLAPTGGTVAG